MEQKSTARIECLAENFVENTPNSTKISLKVNFNNAFVKNDQSGEEAEKSQDTLKITILNEKPIPQDVKTYIQENLGVFEFSENESEKSFLFELQINDINTDAVRAIFETHFAQNIQNFALSFDYEKSEDLEVFGQELKTYHRVPLFLQLMEKARLNVNCDAPAEIVASLLELLKANNSTTLHPWVKVFVFFLRIKMRMEGFSFKKLNLKAFEDMNFDQIDNFKEFFLPLDNPINSYAFSGQRECSLKVSGRILNVLDYEFFARLPNFSKLIDQVDQL